MWNYICTCILAHQSKPHGDESRPELLLNLTLSSLAVSVLHIDPLPPPDAAHSPLGSMAAHFFSTLGPQHLAQLAFLQSRNIFNQACPHDHLRWRQNQLGNSVRSKCYCVVTCVWSGFRFAGSWSKVWRSAMSTVRDPACGPSTQTCLSTRWSFWSACFHLKVSVATSKETFSTQRFDFQFSDQNWTSRPHESAWKIEIAS